MDILIELFHVEDDKLWSCGGNANEKNIKRGGSNNVWAIWQG